MESPRRTLQDPQQHGDMIGTLHHRWSPTIEKVIETSCPLLVQMYLRINRRCTSRFFQAGMEWSLQALVFSKRWALRWTQLSQKRITNQEEHLGWTIGLFAPWCYKKSICTPFGQVLDFKLSQFWTEIATTGSHAGQRGRVLRSTCGKLLPFLQRLLQVRIARHRGHQHLNLEHLLKLLKVTLCTNKSVECGSGRPGGWWYQLWSAWSFPMLARTFRRKMPLALYEGQKRRISRIRMWRICGWKMWSFFDSTPDDLRLTILTLPLGCWCACGPRCFWCSGCCRNSYGKVKWNYHNSPETNSFASYLSYLFSKLFLDSPEFPSEFPREFPSIAHRFWRPKTQGVSQAKYEWKALEMGHGWQHQRCDRCHLSCVNSEGILWNIHSVVAISCCPVPLVVVRDCTAKNSFLWLRWERASRLLGLKKLAQTCGFFPHFGQYWNEFLCTSVSRGNSWVAAVLHIDSHRRMKSAELGQNSSESLSTGLLGFGSCRGLHKALSPNNLEPFAKSGEGKKKGWVGSLQWGATHVEHCWTLHLALHNFLAHLLRPLLELPVSCTTPSLCRTWNRWCSAMFYYFIIAFQRWIGMVLEFRSELYNVLDYLDARWLDATLNLVVSYALQCLIN